METADGTRGDRILKALKHLGISQNELARRLGKGSGWVSRLVTGERGESYVDPMLWQQVGDALHVNYEWLLTGRGEMFGSAPVDHVAGIARQYSVPLDFIERTAAANPDLGPFELLAKVLAEHGRASRDRARTRDYQREVRATKRRATEPTTPPPVPVGKHKKGAA